MKVSQPIYKQIAAHIREQIENGEYSFGQLIPSEQQLSEMYRVSRMTLRKAVAILVGEGLLIPRPGKGTFVNRQKIDMSFDNIQGTSPFLLDMGLSPSVKVLRSGKRTAGYKYSRIMGISENSLIYQLVRLRLGDGEPYILEYTNIPYDLIPNIEQYDFEIYSLYDLIRQQDIVLTEDMQTLEVVKLSAPQSTLLDVPEGEYGFMTHEVVRDQYGQVIEYTKSYSSGKRFVFSAIME